MEVHEEKVIIVDRVNQEKGVALRSEMRSNKLIHRASYILVFNSKNELFVQKRTATKDIYPGYFDIAAGGVVKQGETYEESATRELQEELGILAPLQFHFDQYFEDATNKVWGRVFSCHHEGPFTLQKEEVESGEFLSIQEVFSTRRTLPYTPDGLIILNKMFPNKH